MIVSLCVPNRNDFKGQTVGTIARLTWDTCFAGHNPSYLSAQSCFIDVARNLLWDSAKSINSDYILFLDTDVAVTNDYKENIIKRLIDLNKDVVVGLYVEKKHPHRLHIYDFTIDGLLINIPEWPNEPFKIGAGPTGFMFISKKVMDAFTPDFISRYGKPFDFMDYGEKFQIGEDVAFCKRCKELGFEVWADPTINLVHMGDSGYTVEDYKHMKELSAQRFENGIQGWMTPLELEFLAMQSTKMKTIVEVGSWKGRSTKALLDSGKKVYAVDTFEGSQDTQDLTCQMAKQENVFEEFKKNVGSYPNLKIIKKTSLGAAKMFSDKSVDMVFIDANHTYEEVEKDILAWKPKAKRFICGHDYSDGWPGVKKAVKEVFGDKFKVTASIWWVEL